MKLYPGVETPLKDKGPEDIDFVVVRENTEDMYAGVRRLPEEGHAGRSRHADQRSTPRKGCERCIRCAFEFTPQAQQPEGKMLTLVAKTNVLTFGHDLWWRAFQEIGAEEYPDIKRDYNHVDACCMWMVKNPE